MHPVEHTAKAEELLALVGDCDLRDASQREKAAALAQIASAHALLAGNGILAAIARHTNP